MNAFVFIAMTVLLVGLFAGIQGPLNALLANRIGLLGAAFVVHLVGLLFSGSILLVSGGRLADWRGVPWYGWLGGALGVSIVMALSYATPRIGIAGTVVLFVVAQLAAAAVVGHFGWLETPVKPMDLSRLLGLLLLLAGAWLVVKPS
ncbi:DMT family transporter [Meiothermus granaticius]|uniref:Putative inner membrane exporter, YdcZ n=1 Tax=Meiothermus granaticius NBRC 107808 TaxID=1227551 RepID=A0A399F777_9DEIN|nr:DMT family transporter [Meiothermus granaticius]RIH92514.1 putative inner membrane exporter, YdcZ [Meiothermus granaticius NBRC 107808]GEM87002.1 membrane protein [Meiothermus granaticius NBRC 107808]